ncbi:MAG TPA: right-handed parallel beta-helix repeat-containing protein [Planctomycetota bacterium]|nr:right-handed parallel beta-helix repeat-containing protein [Planctomycetota bacterium]
MPTIGRSLFLFAALFAAPAARASTVWHVDAAAACPGAGTTLAPFCRIQLALDAAALGDEIVVAPGLYLERLDFLGKDVLLRSSAGAASTVVDAESLGSVVTFAHGEGPGAVLRGFTLRNGSGTDTGPTFSVPTGGGVYCLDASPTIADNVIELNRAYVGAGLALRGGAALVSGNTVRTNTAEYQGGGIHCGAGTTARLLGNTIQANGLYCWGGGIYVVDSAPTIEGNLVEDNLASGSAGIHIDSDLAVVVRGNVIRGNATDEDEGGGLAAWNGSATLVEDNEITDNSCHGNGAGVYAMGGTYRNNRIIGNWGGDHSSVLAAGGPTFDGDVIADNHAKVLVVGSAAFTRVTITGHPGVAVLVLGGQPLFEDCVIVDNVEGVEADETGTLVTLRRCTFAGNQYSAVVTWGGGRAVLESCIAWGNALSTGLELAPETGSIDASWSIVRLGYPGTGNLDVDPLFADPAGGDYALLPGSPAIDSGDPADGVCGFDRSGMPRRLDGLLDCGSRVDRGALEFGNGRLAVSSPAAGALRLGLDGTPGLPAALLAGLTPGQACLEKWGTLGIDLGAPSLVLPWPGAPSSVMAQVPPALSGLPVVLQALVGPSGFATGNFTNAELLLLP